MSLNSSRALRHLGLSTEATQDSVSEKINFCLAALAHDQGRRLGSKASAAAVADLKGLQRLFDLAPLRSERGGGGTLSSPRGLPYWAGCWCKGELCFAKYSK